MAVEKAALLQKPGEIPIEDVRSDPRKSSVGHPSASAGCGAKRRARMEIAKIEPIRDVARLPGHASVDDAARGPRVHTPDQEIRISIRRVIKQGLLRFNVRRLTAR